MRLVPKILPDLPLGIESETTFIAIIALLLPALWAIFLLLAGNVFDRAAVGTFFMAVGLLLGWFTAAAISLWLALLLAFVIFAAGLALYFYSPRIALTIAMFWPLPAIYFAHLYFTGSFSGNPWVGLGLLVAGVACGILLARASVAIIASALGALILGVLWPDQLKFIGSIAIFITGAIWQMLAQPRLSFFKKWPVASLAVSPEDRKTKYWGGLRIAAALLLASLISVAFLAPQPLPSSPVHENRLQALRQNGGLDRPGLIFSSANVFYLTGRALPVAILAEKQSWWNRLRLIVAGKSPAAAIHRLRAHKDENELEKLRRAAAITARAFEHIAPLIKPGRNENEIAQEILNMFRENGATGLAFPLIVGSGANATRPHYSANNAVMNKGLVVIDIGCSVENYASDMTRTFAVNGRFSAAERELMDIVIAAGDSARAHLKPGATMRDLHERAARVIAAAGFGPYFTHMLSHHVGLEVHDPQINTLAAGMVITIEPGIYIPAGAAVDSVYWDLGVRIEDTYIVTENGFEQITHFPHMWPAREDSLPARFDP
ncbi:M24 family metallopeptidase [bacterium]|nr:M24 family metallopeptidase [bacterium]